MKKNSTTLKLFLLAAACVGTLFQLTSCASMKQGQWLAAHQKALSEAANSKIMKPEEKADLLMSRYAQMMEEGLKFIDPVKGSKYIIKYQEQNQASIEKIVAESQLWVSNLNTMQGVDLGLRVAKKPYINQYIDLVPKFKKKYNQYKFIVETTGKVLSVFGKVGKFAALAL